MPNWCLYVICACVTPPMTTTFFSLAKWSYRPADCYQASFSCLHAETPYQNEFQRDPTQVLEDPYIESKTSFEASLKWKKP